jgi:hypothetical protein
MKFSNTVLSSESVNRIPDLSPKMILNLVMNSRKNLNVTFYSPLHHAAESKKNGSWESFPSCFFFLIVLLRIKGASQLFATEFVPRCII